MVNFTPKLVNRKGTHAVPEVPSRALEQIKAKDLMTKSFPKFFADMPMEAAVSEFVKHPASGGPVVQGNDILIGYLSQRDVLILARESKLNHSEAGQVKKYMYDMVRTIDENTNLLELVDLFSKEWFHNYPVVCKGKLVGMIDRHAVLRAFADFHTTTW